MCLFDDLLQNPEVKPRGVGGTTYPGQSRKGLWSTQHFPVQFGRVRSSVSTVNSGSHDAKASGRMGVGVQKLVTSGGFFRTRCTNEPVPNLLQLPFIHN
eukprot:762973-Hanusia_phi.AAC.3